jgi:hypothetical protein
MTRLLNARKNVDTIALTCGSPSEQWMPIYRDDQGTLVEAYQEPGDQYSFVYRAIMPAYGVSMSELMSLANETDLVRTWQTMLATDPVVLGARHAQHLCTWNRLSLLAGLVKIDFCNEIQRFVDVKHGMLVEYIRSIDKAWSDPCVTTRYVDPKPPYRRTITEVKNVWLALGERDTLLIQVNRIKVPVPMTKWLFSMLGYILGKLVASSLIDNAVLVKKPGSKWIDRLAQDKCGLYRLLNAASQSPAAAEHAAKFLPELEKHKKLPSDTAEYLARLFERDPAVVEAFSDRVKVSETAPIFADGHGSANVDRA